ncbi:hypothetical protein MRX96_039999 [Rhipicephalus microplus]
MDPCADASRGCAVIMPEAMVDGETITEEEASAPGWIDAFRRREKSSTTTTGRTASTRIGALRTGTVTRVAAVSRLPNSQRITTMSSYTPERAWIYVATITAQQLQIQELTRQLPAALAHQSSLAPPLSPAPTPYTLSSPAPAEKSINTAPSAASSRAYSPTRKPPQKRRSPFSDTIAPHERDVVRETACFLESFKQRIMSCFTRLEKRVALSTRTWPPSTPTSPP